MILCLHYVYSSVFIIIITPKFEYKKVGNYIGVLP